MKENSTRHYRVPLLLPVRPKFAPWQTIKTWCQQLWQLWHTPLLRVQLPLQPGRHKPFPQRPHQARRQVVFAALDAAPVGLTRRQLIAHVRTVTGIGCSEKLITQWRQERCNANAKEQQNSRGIARRGGIGLWLCLCINACATTSTTITLPASEITILPAASEAPTLSNFKSQIANSPSPRLLRIKLTINAASDLLVKTDDDVQAEQPLTNRSHECNRLFAQRRVLETQAQQIEAQLTTATESLSLLEQRGATLPPFSFASEQAAITKAEAEAVTVNRAVEIQQLRVTSFASLVSSGERSKDNQILTTRNPKPETRNYAEDTDTLSSRNAKPETRNLITDHETAKLTFAQDAAHQAAAEVALQKAKLTSAQESRAFAEKQHALEVAQQLLSARQHQQQAVLARSQLLAQIAALDVQLAQLAAVRAPFSGKIKRIEWEDMNNETITVLVYLSLGSR